MESECLALRLQGEEADDEEEEDLVDFGEEDPSIDEEELDDEVIPRSFFHMRYHQLQTKSQFVCLRSRPCTVCLYLALVLLLLSSTVALVVVGILVVTPYHRASYFAESVCSAELTRLDYAERRCSCGKGCHSQYPCARVTVRVLARDLEPWTAMLFEDESMLHHQCSLYPSCTSSTEENHAVVSKYVTQYGVSGRNYTCLYDPRHVTDVIRTRRFQTNHVVNGILWPAVLFCAAISGILLTVRDRGCMLL